MGCWTRSAKALLLGTSAIVLIKSAGISTAYAQDVVAVELDPVTVVATKTRERVSETLAPVSVVRSAPVRSAPAPADVPAAPTETPPQPQGPADQLRAAGPLAGAGTLQQLMPSRASDVFFGMPGVTTQTRGDDPGTAVNIRGMQDFGRVAVLIDGARQNFQRTGHNADGVFYLEPEMLAGVDVVRGPVANIYGSGAIGGVVSFRTKDIEDVVKAGERWGVLSTGMVGSNIFRDMASMFAGARVHPNVDVFGGIVYRHNQNYRDGNGKEWPNTGFDVASGVGKLTMRPGLGHEVKLTGITYETKYATGQPNGPPNTLSIYDTKVQNRILTARYRYSRPDDKLFDFDGNVYSTSTVTEQVKTGGTNSAISGRLGSLRSFRIDTTGFDVNNTSRVDIPGLHNTVTYGADYFRDKVGVIDPTGTGDLFTPDGVRTVSGNFVQWRAQHSPWIETITALRYDNYKLEGGGFQNEGDRVSPKATVGVTPVRGFTVYGTYAEGYRAPAVTETLIFGLHPPAGPTQFGFIPNPQLSPEVGKNKELGVNLRYDDVLTKGDAFRGKVNYFRNDLTDFIELTVVGGGPPCPAVGPGAFCFKYTNLPSARIEGYEFEGTYDAGYWFFGLAGSHIRGRNLITGAPLLKIMPDQLATTLGLRLLDRRLTVAARWLAVDAKKKEDIPDSPALSGSPDLPPSAAYSIVNLYLGYQPTEDITASLGIDNLFNKQYAPYLNTYGGGPTGSTLLPFPSPGITVKGELKVRLGVPAAPIKVAQAR
jgi:hemoglobin/transferrin/lactoferrin receptor protein